MRNLLRAIAFTMLAFVALTLAAPSARAQGVRTADNTPLSNGTVAVCSASPTTPGNVGQPCAPLAMLSPDSSGAVYTITSAVRTSGMVTITTSVANSILVSQSLMISGVSDPSFDGTFQVASQNGNTFSYVQAGANSNASGGAVTGVNPINADIHGNFSFWAAPGTYFIEFYSPSRATAAFTETVTLGCVPNSTAAGCGSGITHDVSAYGAKCDDATDDTAAIQAAVDSLPSSGSSIGGIVSFSGVCRTTATITVSTPNVTFEGLGHFQFITQNAPPSYIDFQGTTPQNAIDVNAQGFAMDNMGVKYPTTIGGPLAPPAAPTLTAITASGCPAEAYYVEATYTSGQGQTVDSSEATITTTTGQCFTVTSPAAESGATGWNVFVSSNSNNETLQNSPALALGANWTFGGTLVNLGFRPAVDTTAFAAVYDPNGAQLNGVKLFTSLSASVGTASQANGYTSFGCCGKLENVYIAGFGIGILGSGSNNDFSIKDSYVQADNVGAFIVNGADINIEDDDFEGNGLGNIKMLYGSPYQITGNYFEQQGSNPPSYNVQLGDTTIPPQGFTPTPGAINLSNNFMQCNLTVYPPAPIVIDTTQVVDIERNSFSQCEHENIVQNLASGSTAHIKMLGNISDATPLAWLTSTTGVVESDVNGTSENPSTPAFYGLNIDSQSGPSSITYRNAGTNEWGLTASPTAYSVSYAGHTGENTLQVTPFGSQSYASVLSNYAMTAAEVIVTQSGGSATFDAGLGNTFELIMSANVTSSTLVNAQPGQWLDFIICQGGGGPWTFAWPSNVFGGGTVGTTNGPCSTQQFYVSGSSPANAWAAGPMTINVTSGSTGLSLPAVSGTVPYFTGSWTNGNCLEAGGSTGLITVTSGACGPGGGGSPGGATYALQYNNATFAGLSSPTSGAGFYTIRYDPSSTTAVAPTADQDGLAPRSLNGSASTDTVAYTDLFSLVIHDVAATSAVTETLPTPTTLSNSGFAYTYCNNSAYTDSIAPTTWTISLNNGSAGSSISVPSSACVHILTDPHNADKWDAFNGSPSFGYITSGVNTSAGMTCGTGCSLTPSGSGVIESSETNSLNDATGQVYVNGATAPTSGQVLTATGASAAAWETPSTPSSGPYYGVFTQGGTSGGEGTTANVYNILPFMAISGTIPIADGNLLIGINTDDSSDNSSFGVAVGTPGGTCTVEASTVATTYSSAGIQSVSLTGSIPALASGQRYYFIWTSAGSVIKLNYSSALTYLSSATHTNGTTSGGSLGTNGTSTFTCPADSWSATGTAVQLAVYP
jgi:hypothetical protein